jgi:hypothetical protein
MEHTIKITDLQLEELVDMIIKNRKDNPNLWMEDFVEGLRDKLLAIKEAEDELETVHDPEITGQRAWSNLFQGPEWFTGDGSITQEQIDNFVNGGKKILKVIKDSSLVPSYLVLLLSGQVAHVDYYLGYGYVTVERIVDAPEFIERFKQMINKED